MQINYEKLIDIIDELQYNINDGIGIRGCKRDFTAHEYDIANGTLNMLVERLEKRYGELGERNGIR